MTRQAASLGHLAVLRLERQRPLRPGDQPAADAADVPARGPKGVGRGRRAVAGAAVEDDRVLAVELRGALTELLERDVAGARDAARTVLLVVADVDDVDPVLLDALRRVGGRQLVRGPRLCHRAVRVVGRAYAP